MTGLQGSMYTAAAQRGATSGAQSRTGHVEPVKPVPARHKREIIVTRGEESTAQAQRTGKELVEQLKIVGAGIGGEIVAARTLPSRDIVFITDKEQTCTK